MRIIHVVALFSSIGAFGGPTRVAVNQVEQLRQMGHEAKLVTSAMAADVPIAAIEPMLSEVFIAHKIIPGIGFSGLYSHKLLRWLEKNLTPQDRVHVHLGRDLVSMPAAKIALKSGAQLFVQPHGMIQPSTRKLAKPFDRLLTQEVLSRAERVFYLTPEERSGLELIAPGARLENLVNGTPAVNGLSGSESSAPEVLFFGRLHSRKRPQFVVSAARALAKDFPTARFSVVGPDAGCLGEIQRDVGSNPVGNLAIEPAIAVSHANARIARCSVFVLPSVDEPFPMSVLEALALGKPVIVTESCGLAAAIEHEHMGIVVNDSQQSFNEAVAKLLTDPALRMRMGHNARAASRQHFSMHAVGSQLVRAYA